MIKKKWWILILVAIVLFGMGNAASATSGGSHGASDAKYLPYDYVGGLSEGFAYYCNVSGDGLCGFIDTNGNVVIEAQFDSVYSFADGLASVSKDEKWGFIDTKGNVVVPLDYDDVAVSFSEGFAAVAKEDQWGFVDKTGKEVIPLIYEYAESFHEGLAIVLVDGKYGFINQSGEMVIEPQFDDAYPFSSGLAPVMKDDYWGFIDKSGNLVVPYQYDLAFTLSDGMALVLKDMAWGYVNSKGEEVIPPKYESADHFSEGLAPVMIGGLWGYIDKTGNIVIEPQYPIAEMFSEGVALVYKEWDQGGYIDATGKAVTGFDYMWANSFSGGYALVSDGGISSFYFIEHPLKSSGTETRETTPEAKPEEPAAPEKADAKPSSNTILVNGQQIAFEAYNIGGNNYFKLRDLASALNGTEKQFEVTWDASANAIRIISGQAYTPVGGELAVSGETGVKTAQRTSSSMYLDGAAVQWTAYNIGGNNYFKLRDIGKALDFYVGWDAAANTVIIDTTKGYSE